MKQPSPETLRELLSYDPDTGQLTWRERPESMFKPAIYGGAKATCARWNTRFCGKAAFTTKAQRGYLMGYVFTKSYLAHRVAWAIHYGVWPSGEIDHINGAKDDNRIINLRDVSHGENMRNVPKKKTNKSGATGVRWNEQYSKWHAYATARGTRHCFGFFDCLDEAVAARSAGIKQIGIFSERHGK